MIRNLLAAFGFFVIFVWVAGNVVPGFNVGVYVGSKQETCFNFKK
jgi:hypothetical protein